MVLPPVSSYQVEGFFTLFYDGYRPNRLADILKLSAFIGAPPPRPESGYLYPQAHAIKRPRRARIYT